MFGSYILYTLALSLMLSKGMWSKLKTEIN